MDAMQSQLDDAAEPGYEREPTALSDRRWRPVPLPAVPGGSFDALHFAQNRRAVGVGAWCDAFAIARELIVISIGERAGPARSAQRALGEIRTLFTSAGARLKPATLLDRAATLLRAQAPAGTTAIVGVLDLATRRFTYISAGGLPPFVRYGGGGGVAALPGDDGSTGSAERDLRPLAHVTVDVLGAERLTFYTGGLIRTAASRSDGLQRLHDILAADRGGPAAGSAERVARSILRDPGDDDIAVLTFTFSQPAPPPRPLPLPQWSVSWSFEATPANSHGARSAFLAALHAKPRPHAAVDLYAAELIFGELLSNVVRHAPGRVEITLDWTAELPVLHVIDSGPGYRSRGGRECLPVDAFSESGRGLFLINACAANFRVRNGKGGGTHVTATLRCG